MKFKAVLVVVFVIFFLGITTTAALSQSASTEIISPGLTSPSPEEEVLPDCFICHTRVLTGHDKLGSGTEACLICHNGTHMGMLRLLDGTELSPSNSPQLCGQCHKTRYDAWEEGAHGVLTLEKGNVEISEVQKPKCADCHEPHQPQLSLTTAKAYPSPASVEGGKLDCLSCHVRALKGHDKLGSGTEACWTCHLSTQMTTLHLADGETLLLLSDSERLCGQCHQARYEAWEEGTHGVPAWKLADPAIVGVGKVTCVNCHEPHQPQIALLDITKPHPLPTPAPPPPPVNLLMILGISLVLMTALGIVVARKGEWPWS
ncbi:hypothetical protein ACFLU1_02465 [Chloroflexota bacterium]